MCLKGADLYWPSWRCLPDAYPASPRFETQSIDISPDFILSVYSADDAVPLSPNPMPNRYEGLIVRGQRKGRVRSIDYAVDLPQLPDTASFFDQQAEHRDDAKIL